ncbi:Invasion protein B family protein [compost metagenome]
MLVNMGIPPEKFRNLDSHSTIVLQVSNYPDIMFSWVSNRLWIWSILPEINELRLFDAAAEVTPIVAAPVQGAEGGMFS